MQLSNTISSQVRPVFIIGAGGIVVNAHLPAYKLAGFNIQGIYDSDTEKSRAAASRFAVPRAFSTMDEMLRHAPTNAVFDVAVPGSAMLQVLTQLPDNAIVLIQKPMGENLAAARQILQLTRRKKMLAAVNFQLRYAPAVVEARRMIDAGLLGEIADIEININVYTPWHLWKFLFDAPRVEILYHSIHYIDLIRSFLGNPEKVLAKTTGHPAMKELASVRSNIIMDYGHMVRASIATNHAHLYGLTMQQSYIKIEGSKGAVKIDLGVLKNYPHGEPERFAYIVLQEEQTAEWKQKEMEGNWFPHAFIGSMMQLMEAADQGFKVPDNSVEDCINTMACVEAAYISNEKGGIVPEFE
jgi:predicted dehydrogenase